MKKGDHGPKGGGRIDVMINAVEASERRGGSEGIVDVSVVNAVLMLVLEMRCPCKLACSPC